MPPPPIGHWTTEAPLTPDQVDEDRAVLSTLGVRADGAILVSAEVYVNGRLWRWEPMGAPFHSVIRR